MINSKYFTNDEITRSNTAKSLGIINRVFPEHEANVYRTALYMDIVREFLGAPINPTSWYRNPELNKAVGGEPNSQHARGEAVDFVCPGFGSPIKIVRALEKSRIPFDQLILEPTWVHISFIRHTPTNIPRRQVLTLVGPRKYAPGIVEL